RNYQPGPVPLRLVLELAAHLVRRPSVDGAREAVVLGHLGGCQVLDHDDRLGSRQCRSELVQPVQADACNPVPYLLVPEEGLKAILASLRLPGEGLLGVPLLHFNRSSLGLSRVVPSLTVAGCMMPQSTPATGPSSFSGTLT